MCPRRKSEPPIPDPVRLPTPPPTNIWTACRADDKRAALLNQQELSHDLSTLLTYVTSGHFSPDGVKRVVLDAQKHLAGLETSLSNLIEPQFYNERRDDACTAAQKTFDVAELLEMILDYVEIPDIVNCSQVNHPLKDSIAASTKIQDKLSLRAASDDTHTYAPFDSCLWRPGGFRCLVDDERSLSHHVGLSPSSSSVSGFCIRAYFFPFPGERLPRIGPTYRRMFVCQPPIEEMSVHLTCCSFHQRSLNISGESALVTAEDGLTIGHLYDRAEKLIEEHRNCRHASPSSMDNDGVVETGVQFKSSVGLPLDHPIVVNHMAALSEEKVRKIESTARWAKLSAYRDYRATAEIHGEQISSLREFELAHAGTDWIELGRRSRYSPPLATRLHTQPRGTPLLPLPPSQWQPFDAGQLDHFDFDSFLAGD